MIADIFKVLLIDNTTNEVFARTTLDTAGIEIKEESNEIEGGGEVYAIIHQGKKESIKLEDVEFNFDILAKQLGVNMVTGKVTAYAMPKFYTLDSSKAITLNNAPITKDNKLAIYKEDGTSITGTLAGNKVTFTSGSQGDVVEVRTYLYDTDEKAQSIEINNKKFAKGVTCVLETLEISPKEEPLNTIQFIFDSCAFDGGIKIDTKTKRDAAKHNIDLKVLKASGQDSVGRILRIPV